MLAMPISRISSMGALVESSDAPALPQSALNWSTNRLVRREDELFRSASPRLAGFFSPNLTRTSHLNLSLLSPLTLTCASPNLRVLSPLLTRLCSLASPPSPGPPSFASASALAITSASAASVASAAAFASASAFAFTTVSASAASLAASTDS